MPSTIVSFCRREVFETLPGMENAFYRIPASANIKLPSLLTVGDSAYYKPDIDGNNDKIFVSSEQIANSVVSMHITSQLGYRPLQSHPALFSVPNRELTIEEVMNICKQEIEIVLTRQRNWFIELVRMADDDWQLAHRYQMVSDIQRTAARELGLKRDWLDPVEGLNEDKPNCPFCGSGLLSPEAPICPNCKQVHNPEAMAKLQKKLEKQLGISEKVVK